MAALCHGTLDFPCCGRKTGVGDRPPPEPAEKALVQVAMLYPERVR